MVPPKSQHNFTFMYNAKVTLIVVYRHLLSNNEFPKCCFYWHKIFHIINLIDNITTTTVKDNDFCVICEKKKTDFKVNTQYFHIYIMCYNKMYIIYLIQGHCF